MKSKLYSTVVVPFDRALSEYRAAHAAYLASGVSSGKARAADVRAFENLQDARQREGRAWRADDYR